MTDSAGEPCAWVLHTELPLDAVNLHLGELEPAGLLGMAEQDGRTSVYLPRCVPGLSLAGRWEPVPDRDWNETWKEGLQPVTVGDVTVAPPWRAGDDPAARVRLVIEPGQAFGTGHHETTTGCLAVLQELDVGGRAVLDVGTGTGVLALAAARLGAAAVLAVDIDPLAVAAARDNARRNDVDVEVRAGSVDVVRGRYDVVLANLQTDTIVGLAAELAARLAPGGTLIASGVSVTRAATAESALAAAGLAVWTRRGREWAVLVAHAPHTSARAQDPGEIPGS